MTAFVSFEALADQMRRDLKKHFREVLPAATMVALTRTAVMTRDALKEDIQRVFRHPVPYVVNAPFALPATKDTLASAVGLKNLPGHRASYFLGAEIDSGPRRIKRFEKELRSKGILPADKFVIPGKGIPLDQNGDLKPSDINRILTALQAHAPTGYVATKAAKRRGVRRPKKKSGPSERYYVKKDERTGNVLGIYKETKNLTDGHGEQSKESPIMAFVKQPMYKNRFPFEELARKHIEATFPAQLDKALSELGNK